MAEIGIQQQQIYLVLVLGVVVVLFFSTYDKIYSS